MLKASLLRTVTLAALAAPGFNAALAQTVAGSPASASNTRDQGPGDEIIVTAQRRSESVQKTPVAVTALGGDALAQRGATDLTSIGSSVPGLNVAEQVGQARLTLRGIGVDNISAGAESSVAFNQDNIFFSRSAAALAAFYDVNRVEVLRGPQGTLYGRNATGGSVNIITNRPTFTRGGGVSLTAGNYETLNAEAKVNIPLSNVVATRFSGQILNHSGYGRNIITGSDIDSKHSVAVRGQMLFEPDDRLSVLVGADYFKSSDRSNSYRYLGAAGETAAGAPITPTGILLGGVVPDSPRDLSSAHDPRSTAQFWGVRADIGFKLSDTISLRSLSAYRSSQYFVETDINLSGLDLFPVFNREKSDQYSQEFQLNWETSRNNLIVGAYYLNEKIDGAVYGPLNLQAVGGPDLFVQGYYAGGKLDTQAVAVFAQDTFKVTDAFRFTAGARYSWEEKQVADQFDFDFDRLYDPANTPRFPVHSDKQSFDAFTPKIGLEYDLASQIMVYASFSKGFKAGTYNLGSTGPALRPEKVNAYEAGLKSTILDGRLRANIAGFYYDYSDLQVGKVQGQLVVLENAATARIYGVEGEFTLEPVDDFLIGLNASYLHARFTQYVTADQARPGGDGVAIDQNGLPAFNLAGNSLPQAPAYTVDLSAQYKFDIAGGDITLRGESYWSDRVYFTPFNRDVVSQAPYNLQNAFITYKSDGGLRLTGFVRNIGNKTIKASGQVATTLLGSPIIGFVKPPRTYGLTLSFDY